MTSPQHVKILFKYYSQIVEEDVAETMWATIVNKDKGIYRLDNIPFYGAPIANKDVFFAEFDEEEDRLTFKKILTPSGNSVIFVATQEGLDKQIFREAFHSLGCNSEGMNHICFTMEVPQKVNYQVIQQKLNSFVEKEMLEIRILPF